jgi:hypothetical protein
MTMMDISQQDRIEGVLRGLPSDWLLHARQVIEEFSSGLSDLEQAFGSAGRLEDAQEVVKTYQQALGREMD